ncbi:MAG: 23S rRNA (pseudouridine(1915)-N(3))-methyltransferase RlmH [Mycoplasmatales bacterium]
MQIDLITVGQVKEKYLVQAVQEYTKRLSKFCKLTTIEVKDESNKLTKEEVLKKEALKINEKIKEKTFLIVLAIEGKQVTSEQFSELLDDLKLRGNSHVTFLIGGSYGIDKQIKAKANLLLSFSNLTFPHQLFKVLVLEQIYRAFKISYNEQYHK